MCIYWFICWSDRFRKWDSVNFPQNALSPTAVKFNIGLDGIYTHAKRFQCNIKTRWKKSLSFLVSVTKWWFDIAFYFVEHILCRLILFYSSLLYYEFVYFTFIQTRLFRNAALLFGWIFVSTQWQLSVFDKSVASNFKSKSLNMFYTIMPFTLLLWALLPLSNHSFWAFWNWLRNTCAFSIRFGAL